MSSAIDLVSFVSENRRSSRLRNSGTQPGKAGFSHVSRPGGSGGWAVERDLEPLVAARPSSVHACQREAHYSRVAAWSRSRCPERTLPLAASAPAPRI